TTTAPSNPRPSRAVEMKRRREDLRARGMCIVCRKRSSEKRSTCTICSTAAKTRVSARQHRLRHKQERFLSARALEAAGDAAMRQFMYVDAQLLYEQALRHSDVLPLAIERHICRSIAFSLRNGSRPDRATAWFERALTLYPVGDPRAGVPILLRYLAHQ